jgi:hypothetical protein
MLKADEYLRKAENCERLAQKGTLPEPKRMLEEVAQRWRHLAAQAERDETM